jgi:hypothetical protein
MYKIAVMNINKKLLYSVAMVLLVLAAFTSCKKLDRPALGDYPKDDQVLPPGDLRFFTSFDKQGEEFRYKVADSISTNPSFYTANPLDLVPGINGMAVKGKDADAIQYLNANDMKDATSFTVAFWMKQSVNNRTEFLFSLKDDTYGWSHSALFMMIEHGTATEATVKVGVMDQWMEFPDGNKLKKPILDGNWHHWAMTYDENTSKMTYYFDGALVENAPASATDVKNGDNPRGKLDFTKTTNLVIGGWNKHVGLAGPTDDWVSSYTGSLDQFRMYNKVLSASEINALYTGKL